MGAKTSSKAVSQRSARAAAAPKKSAGGKSSGNKDSKYAETGAPWWKRYLPA
jgi:hypothetical protein